MHVQELMATDVVTIDRNDDLRLVDDIMAERHIRHIPVLEDTQVVGLVTQRDLFKARMPSTMGYGEKGQRAYLHTVRVKEIMVYPVITITPATSVSEATDLMLQKEIGCLPVVQEDKLLGIVTKTDLLRHLRTVNEAGNVAEAGTT